MRLRDPVRSRRIALPPMFKVLILFGKPVDEISFQRYFEESHCPIVKRIPRLETANFNWVAGSIEGDAPYYLVVELIFAAEEALQDGLNSEAGQAMAQDFTNFASGGVTILLCTSSDAGAGDE
jgi:uncharacterized protein (TIGR02118 family)